MSRVLRSTSPTQDRKAAGRGGDGEARLHVGQSGVAAVGRSGARSTARAAMFDSCTKERTLVTNCRAQARVQGVGWCGLVDSRVCDRAWTGPEVPTGLRIGGPSGSQHDMRPVLGPMKEGAFEPNAIRVYTPSDAGRAGNYSCGGRHPDG